MYYCDNDYDHDYDNEDAHKQRDSGKDRNEKFINAQTHKRTKFVLEKAFERYSHNLLTKIVYIYLYIYINIYILSLVIFEFCAFMRLCVF